MVIRYRMHGGYAPPKTLAIPAFLIALNYNTIRNIGLKSISCHHTAVFNMAVFLYG